MRIYFPEFCFSLYRTVEKKKLDEIQSLFQRKNEKMNFYLPHLQKSTFAVISVNFEPKILAIFENYFPFLLKSYFEFKQTDLSEVKTEGVMKILTCR